MTITYKIIAFDKSNAQLVIRVGDLAPMAIDLPVDDQGQMPSGQELENYLQGFIPTWHFERKAKISNGLKNADEIAALVEPEPVATPTTEQLTLQARATRNAELAACDWTQISDVPLTDAQKAEWASYRKALRDLPAQAGFPINITWPIEPK
jgi:hypothetical protein